MRMIDSWGSLPSGILYGNRKDLGNYDECLSINHVITTGHSVKGKYCFSDVPIGDLLLGSSAFNAKTAVCFPSSCSADNMDILIKRLYKQLLGLNFSENLTLVNEASCSIAEREPLDGLTLFTIILLSILACSMVSATLYDYFICEDQRKLPPIVRAFSARANSRSIFRIVDSKSNPNVIDCLHGIRCMSLIWVIFCHVYMIAVYLPNHNLIKIEPWSKSAFSLFVREGIFAVNTFFFISGLLVVLVVLRIMEKSKGKINLPMMYLHRYLRLTPVLALGILIYMKILPLLRVGPISNGSLEDFEAICKQTWFWTLFYMQNYATTDICLSHSWYLAADMQLFLVASFLLVALYRWGNRAAAGIVVLILLLATCLFCEVFIKHWSLYSSNAHKVTFATHVQASTYLIGLLFGYFLHVNRGKSFKLNGIVVWLLWLTSVGLLFACILGLYGFTKTASSVPYLSEAFYLSLTRIAWPLALCWIVFACIQGYGGLANSFLSSPLWQPLSKISYCAYIFHMFFVVLNGSITRTSTHFSDYQVMLRFWGDFGFTILFAYLMCILIEMPFANLMELLLPKPRKSSTQELTEPQIIKSTRIVE
ncbi:nose resistant to fluoxetine protein 6-like [Drosophila tropicalis]|uniref:nose resistant to fluoxetine protein 6-like n=1 Tax=Drosophila tropicalis TaxID=46794 RepID=UPI0035ABA447